MSRNIQSLEGAWMWHFSGNCHNNFFCVLFYKKHLIQMFCEYKQLDTTTYFPKRHSFHTFPTPIWSPSCLDDHSAGCHVLSVIAASAAKHSLLCQYKTQSPHFRQSVPEFSFIFQSSEIFWNTSVAMIT